MLFDDTFKTIAAPTQGLFRDKGSRFLAYAYPIRSEEEIKGLIQQLRTAHPKARHFCWALRISPDRNIYRFQDDGEPSGTAGRPILNTLLSADLTNILIVVVRYFGGTLLGVPGLINAYKTAAVDAINAATIIKKTLNDIYEIRFEYLATNDVMKLVKDEQLSILSQEFDNSCILQFEVRKANLNVVLAKLEKLGNVQVKYLYSN